MAEVSLVLEDTVNNELVIITSCYNITIGTVYSQRLIN